MYDLLLEAKKLRTRENARAPDSRKVIGKQTQARIELRYDEIIEEGRKLNPEPPRKAGQRGRLARGKALNMLRRLDTRRDEIFSFFTDAEVPFDNNQAERDLRMMKTREKISGTFRSEKNAEAFCALRSVISTARKQSYRVIDILTEVIHAPKSLGEKLTGSH
ncbi:MAG: transposase [Verrucomicrobiales bacterium]|nr:transposase [Verrucomicrobiales bacterium]